MKSIEWTGAVKSLCPSIFDILASLILFISFIPNEFYRGTAFIFYTIFLVSISIMLKQHRKYTSIPLAMLLVWSLGLVFARNNIQIVPGSLINYYFNVSIAFEGFIYILCGILLLKTIIEYSKNMKIVYILLPIALYPIFTKFAYGGRITPLAALVVSGIIYLVLKKEFFIALLLTSTGLLAAAIKWPWIVMKFTCRPYVWIELAKQMGEHPFIGSGFNHTLNPNNMVWVRKIGTVVYGWIYRHNDFLSLGAYLGVFALICISMFTIQSIRRIGISPYLIPFVAIVLTCLFQATMFEPDKAAICLVLGAISLKETYKGDVYV